MRTKILLADEALLASHVVLEPGEFRPREIHVAQSETFLILRGKILVGHPPGETALWLPPEQCGIQSALTIEAGAEHTVANIGEDFAEYISILRRVQEQTDAFSRD